MVGLFLRCPDPRRQPYRWQEGGIPLQARHQRLQPHSVLPVGGTAAAATEAYGNIYSGGTTAIGAGGSGTCCSSTCGCRGDRHPCLPRCVVEGCGGSARAISRRGIGGGTCNSAGDRRYRFPHCIGWGGGQGVRFFSWGGVDGGPGDRRYCSLRCISLGGASSAVAAASEEI